MPLGPGTRLGPYEVISAIPFDSPEQTALNVVVNWPVLVKRRRSNN